MVGLVVEDAALTHLCITSHLVKLQIEESNGVAGRGIRVAKLVFLRANRLHKVCGVVWILHLLEGAWRVILTVYPWHQRVCRDSKRV